MTPTNYANVSGTAFLAAASHIWNSLPDDVVCTELLSLFRRLLNILLFQQSYPDIVY